MVSPQSSKVVLTGRLCPLELRKRKGKGMGSQFLRIKWCGFFFVLSFAVSCTWNLGLKEPMGEEEFFVETSRLEKLAREDPSTSVRAKSHLQLAFVYVNSRNPKLNYSRALQEMEIYLSMSPADAQKDDFQNWLAVLEELDRVRKNNKETEEKKQGLQTQIEKLQISLKKAQDANKDLGNEVSNLQEMIEKLTDLDFQMEGKRNLTK